MEAVTGRSVYGGIAIGKLSVLRREDTTVKRIRTEDYKAETERFHKAREEAKKELKVLYDKALKEVGSVNAMIFEVHRMMLDDPDYVEAVENTIKSQKINAEYAVASTGDNYAEMFMGMEDEYMKERAADIKDISNRVIRVLQGKNSDGEGADTHVILLADDLAPSETVQLDKSKVLSFVTMGGSSNSHTAILARTMNIPALIGVDYREDFDGKLGIVDGYRGKLIVEPDEDTLKVYEKRMASDRERKRLLEELKGKETVTTGGQKVNLYANISGVSDVVTALQNDAEGIGLFRSEFLYLENNTYPTEEQQFGAYKSVVEGMAGRPVIIRTLDIGADKKADYFGLLHEENPAMGYRAIRICLDRPDIFKRQLRAILRASYYGKVSVMYPMIISVSEVQRAKALMEEAREELSQKGIPFGKVNEGIMIETPAAVMISDLLAEEVDFFSIGTNDLSQYTLALDRQNAKLDAIYDPGHPAILRMIEMVVKNGHKHGCWVGICGELGADTSLTEKFLKMGVDELSVSPSYILPVRERVRNI